MVRKYIDGEHLSWSDLALDTGAAGERFEIKPRHGCSCRWEGQEEGDVEGKNVLGYMKGLINWYQENVLNLNFN